METSHKYLCKDNDNVIRINCVEGRVDEYEFSFCTDTSRIIIGADDIKNATRIARKEAMKANEW